MIDDFTAVAIAESWHSVMTWNDPGVWMYSVSSTGKIHSEKHRAALLVYIDGCIVKAAECDGFDMAPTLPEQFGSNVEELEALREWVIAYQVSS